MMMGTEKEGRGEGGEECFLPYLVLIIKIGGWGPEAPLSPRPSILSKIFDLGQLCFWKGEEATL
jgi:hypothetical protein